MSGGWMKGCVVTAVVLGLLVLVTCARFFDASSHQSAEACVAKMSDPILRKVAALPANDVLRTKQARIEHQLYGNQSEARRLAKAFEEKGWEASVQPMDEIGWAAIIAEDPSRFRLQAAQRVKQLCSIAEESSVRYRHWSIVAPGISDYVAQYGDGSVTE